MNYEQQSLQSSHIQKFDDKKADKISLCTLNFTFVKHVFSEKLNHEFCKIESTIPMMKCEVSATPGSYPSLQTSFMCRV